MGRIAFKPTETQRAVVKALASYRIPQEQICLQIGCSEPTLRKRFAQELKTARIEVDGKVTEVFIKNCINPDPRYQQSRIFYLKCTGWKEAASLELSGPGGKPIEVKESARAKLERTLASVEARLLAKSDQAA